MDRGRQIKNNVEAVKNRIAVACEKRGLNADLVHIMAVTKYAAPQDIAALLENTDISIIGESRLQEYEERWLPDNKLSLYAQRLTKCFIGAAQRNKAKKIAGLFDIVSSVDAEKTARFFNEKAAEQNKTLPVFVQIKLTDRCTQGGVNINEASGLVKIIRTCSNLEACGYMAIAPQVENKELLRPLFKQVKALYDRDFPPSAMGKYPFYLSIGMSDDFDIAVEEGSTLPRIGSALFANN